VENKSRPSAARKKMRALISLAITCAFLCQTPCLADWYDNAHGYLERGKQLYRAGQFSDALKSLQECISLCPSTAEGYYWRGITLHSLGQQDRALDDFNEALRLDPDQASYYLSRGLIYLNRKQFDLAVRDFDQVLKLDPSLQEALVNREYALREIDKGKKTEAEKIANEKEEADRLAHDKAKETEQLANQASDPQKAEEARLIKEKEKQKKLLAQKVRLAELAKEKLKTEKMALDEAKAERLAMQKADKEKLAREKLEGKRGKLPARNTDTLTLQKQEINRPIKDKWALIIGISNFQDKVLNMKYAAKDAEDFAHYLLHEGHFAKDHVKLIMNEQATRSRILAELGDKWLPRVANPDDLVFLAMEVPLTLMWVALITCLLTILM
jgi:Flp pilus assembly protein TadD